MNQLVYEYEGKRVEVRLTNRPVSLGRGDEADHKLPTKAASRIHAQVFLRDEAWWVEDLGSSNGTLLNNVRVAKAMPLKSGDTITIGETVLMYEGAAPKPKGPPDHLIARLIYKPEGGGAPVEVLIRDRVTIGRKPENTLQIDNKAVSGQHAEVLNRQGAYLFRDLGSSNGTFVGSQRITEHTLRNGETLLLGKKVEVFFIDPAGHAVGASQPAAAAPASAPAIKAVGAKPVSAPSVAPVAATGAAASPAAARAVVGGPVRPGSAGGASDRGSFEPISAGPVKPVGPNPLPHVLVGVGLGALFLIGGWLLSGVIRQMKQPRGPDANTTKPVEALADADMSFEGDIDDRGNPQGWTASFEAVGTTRLELLSETSEPYDGRRCLSARMLDASGSPGTLVLQTTSARPVNAGGALSLSLYLRGEGGTKAAIAVSLVGERDEVFTVAAGTYRGIQTSNWSQCVVSGVSPGTLPAQANLRLLISGSFTRLWIDRIEWNSEGNPPGDFKFQDTAASSLALRSTPSRPATLFARNAAGVEVRMQPQLLSVKNQLQSEDALWAVNRRGTNSITYDAMLPAQAATDTVECVAQSYESGYFPERGLAVTWKSGAGNTASSLAVQLDIPLPTGASIAVADRLGAPLFASRENIHSYSYATISEIMVSGTDISIAFPDGAVVWLDLTTPGRLTVSVRNASAGRNQLTLRLNSRPLMFARLYSRVYSEAVSLMKSSNFAAAEARLRYLTAPSRVQRDLPVIGNALDRLMEVARRRDEMRTAADKAWDTASTARNEASVIAATVATQNCINAFAADTEHNKILEERLKRLGAWKIELDARKRTPEQMKEAEAVAKTLLDDAQASEKSGNLLLALLLLENLMGEYADTSSFNPATVVHERIQKLLSDAAARDAAINEELKGIDEDIKFRDYARGRNRCLKLFKRYPDTPRNRDIMQRLRQIESAMGD